MSAKKKSEYFVGKRPPATLTAKARQQLDEAKPSREIAELATLVAGLISTKTTGEKFISLPGVETLRPGDVANALTAKEAAAMSRKASARTNSRNDSAKATK